MTLSKSTSDPRPHPIVAPHKTYVASVHMFKEVVLRDRAKLVEFCLFAQKGSIGSFHPQNVLVHIEYVFLNEFNPVFFAELAAFFYKSEELLHLTVIYKVYQDIQLLFPLILIQLTKEHILVIYKAFEALLVKVEFLLEDLDVDLAFRHFGKLDA